MSEHLPVPSTALLSLVNGHVAVDAADPIEMADRRLAHAGREYAAVCRGGVVVGLCARAELRGLLSGRFGFALHSRTRVDGVALREAQVFHPSQPVREVLHAALARTGAAFYEDVIVAGDEGQFLGLISTPRLVAAQSTLIQEQFALVETQRRDLLAANASLSQSLSLQRELERRVIEKEKLALLETMAGGIAHEINNKLHPIVGYAELLLEEADLMPVEDLRSACQSILQCALESSRIIGQLLRLSRPPRSELSPCDVREIVAQSLTLAELRTRGTSTQVRTVLPGRPAMVLGDAGQLKQVVMNLVVNAIDAVEGRADARVTITVRLTDVVTVEVEDTGTGIAPEHVSRIFDPFFTTKAPNRGSGLGLGVCASILRQHGSDIAVQSTPGHGARFSFALPARAEMSGAAPATPFRGMARSAGPSRVLVVDDDPAIRSVIDHTLRQLLGCDVHQASDGHAGRDAIRQQVYDAVVCDVRMPGLNGVELARWLAGRPEPRPLTILMTGEAGDALRDDMEATGLPILRKPFTMRCLVDLLTEGLPPHGPAHGVTHI